MDRLVFSLTYTKDNNMGAVKTRAEGKPTPHDVEIEILYCGVPF